MGRLTDRFGNLLDRSLARGAGTRQHHVRFQEQSVQRDPLLPQRIEHCMKRGVGDLKAALNGVSALEELAA